MRKWALVVILIVVLVLGVGMIGKSNFKDGGIISIKNMEDIRALNCNVNQIFTKEDVDAFMADYPVEFFEQAMQEYCVAVVKPMDNIHQYDFTMTQEVEIVNVINGEIQQGSAVEIVCDGGVYGQEYKYYVYDNDRPIFYGMINMMLPGNEYLVFVEPLETNEYTEKQRYRLAFDLFATWNLSDDYSKPIDKPINEICYNEYENSEFLCDTPETVEKLLSLKKEVLLKVFDR